MPEAPGHWTLFSSHGHVLLYVAAVPRATGREIADALGLSERRVITVLHDLEAAGMVRSRRTGTRKEHQLVASARFRHPMLRHVRVGEVVQRVRPRVTTPRLGAPPAGR